MMGWHWNDGMTMEWAHPRLIHVISASSHHSSPLILIPEWQDWLLNEVWMREWRRNDRHFRIKVNPLDFFWGSSRPIRGLDFELSTNRKPRFWQFHSVSSISITAILSSFRHSTIILSFKSHHEFRMTYESWNDFKITKWLMNDWMTLESFRNHSNHSISSKATSQSTHHPLQRMMGGLTCRYPLEWLSPSFQNHSNHLLSFKARSQSTHHPLQRMMGGLTWRYSLEWQWTSFHLQSIISKSF